MKAVQFVEGEIKTVEVNYPDPASKDGNDWSVLEISSAGICGSDLHLAEIGIFPPNINIGHEFCGVLSDGTAAAIEPIIPCGVCDRCEEGRYNICADVMSSIAGMGADGGMAEAVLAHKSQIVPLPKGVSLQDGCLVEPLAVCVHGFERLNFAPETFSGMSVAIIGGGTIGQCALAIAKKYGAEVTLFSRHPAQKEAAEKLGGMSEKPAGQYDLVVDSAGTESALKQAVSSARSGAKMLLLATYWGGMTLPGTELCMKEIDIVPAIMYCSGASSGQKPNSGQKHRHASDFIEAAEILAKTTEISEAIITHRFGLSEASHAFEVASDRSAGAIKVVLDPTN